MTLNFENCKGKQRKALVNAICEILGQEAEYLKAPSYGYNIGDYNVDKDGTVTGKYRHSLIAELAERGFVPTEMPQAPNRLVIEYPLEKFTAESRTNLKKLIEAKATLIMQTLGISELPIEETTESLRFAWFPIEADSETVNAYAQFITALCKTAQSKKRVVARPQDFENPRFSMRTWMNSLGLIGKEYDLCRKLMMSSLSGNSGFRFGKESTSTARRDGVQREVLSIRLRPETIAKLTENASQHEGNISRNMLIESILEKYIQAEGAPQE